MEGTDFLEISNEVSKDGGGMIKKSKFDFNQQIQSHPNKLISIMNGPESMSVIQEQHIHTLTKLDLKENWKPAIRDQLGNMIKLNLHKYFEMNVQPETDEQGSPAFLKINLTSKGREDMQTKSEQPSPT